MPLLGMSLYDRGSNCIRVSSQVSDCRGGRKRIKTARDRETHTDRGYMTMIQRHGSHDPLEKRDPMT